MAYSSLIDMIFTSRAKETAQTIRTFAERALMEGKRQNDEAFLELKLSNIEYKIGQNGNKVITALSNGFSANSTAPTANCIDASFNGVSFNGGVNSKPTIGLSFLNPPEGYFVACGTKNYCAAAVKMKTKNSFIACIKKPNSTWEALL